MNFSKKAIFAVPLLILLFTTATAQSRKTRITREEYIDRYKSIAVDQKERYGIPASITMAQGILESDCGNSWLSKESNNHFGIKCKRNWTGDKVYYDDDAKGECFRAYSSVEESYHDHAEFLDKQPRYDALFAYADTDYKNWARGLKKAGYATASDYAERLIRIIEESKLYLLDQPDGERLYASKTGGHTSDDSFTEGSSVESAQQGTMVDPDNYRVSINTHMGYNVYEANGVHYVLAKDNDSFENIGRKFRLSARNLRKFNDIGDKHSRPMPGEVIYIEKKKKHWDGQSRIHICREGDTPYAIGQKYAIRMRNIEKMNRLKDGARLRTGQEIRIK